MGTVNGTKTEHRCKQCKFQSNLWTDYQWPSVKSKSVKLKPELSVQLEVVAEACELVALGRYFYYSLRATATSTGMVNNFLQASSSQFSF